MRTDREVSVTRRMNKTSVRLMATSLVALGSFAVQAEPLSLTASHSWMHDSNLARTQNPISDTVNVTGLQVGLNKQYGRQTYSGSAKVSAVRYSKFGDLLNNDSKDVDLGFSSDLLSNWRVALDGSYGENLNQFENNKVTEHLVKNIRTTKNAQGQLIYGVSGIWALVGSVGKATLGYSVPAYQNLNYRQDQQGLKAVYYSTDLLNYSLGLRHVNSQYTLSGEEIDENNLDLSTNWVVSGLSQLSATVSWTDSKRRIQADRRFNGLTGHLNWNYTPRGVLSYGVSAYRTSNSDQYNVNYLMMDPSGGATLGTSQLAFNNRVTAVNLYAKWMATAKMSLTASTGWNRYNVENDLINNKINDTSHFRRYGLVGTYAPERWLKLSAGVSKYSQTKDATRNPYSGRSVDLSASFTLD